MTDHDRLAAEPCAVCGGSGELCADYRSYAVYRQCDFCEGLGWFNDEPDALELPEPVKLDRRAA